MFYREVSFSVGLAVTSVYILYTFTTCEFRYLGKVNFLRELMRYLLSQGASTHELNPERPGSLV